MKARVKATGDIIDVLYKFQTVEPNPVTKYETFNGERYFEEDVEFFEDSTPDDWTRLEYQYVGMAMQGILSNANHALWDRENNAEGIAKSASAIAHALIQKLKEKEERK